MSKRAVVIGGSIAGLLSARVLADNFTKVAIVETDKLPEQPDARSGVPQSVQPHVLFTKGYRILEELFPGIGNELTAAGALTIDWAREFHHFSRRGWSANAESPSDIISFTCSRPLLEWAIRRRLRNLSQVQFVEQHRAVGLLYDSSQQHVTGIRLRLIGSSAEDELPASLVVDASGRRSQAPQWLESLGFTPPPETVVNPFLGYATRRYREPEGFQADWKVMLISQSPPDGTRLGYLAKIEGGEWIATLGGYGKDFPPIDNAGFLEFARSLPSPEFYTAIAAAEPTSPIYAHRATSNRQRHYEKVALPRGFVALGDAVCALCPVYGQGMTVSALSAIVLRDWLRKSQRLRANGSLLPSRFQKRLAKSNSPSWNLATGQDLRFPTTSGEREPSKSNGFLRWYIEQLISMANEDPKLHTLFLETAHLLKSPIALFHPKVVFRVVTRNIFPVC
ncbi:MAG: monooxygenase [Chroococcidiopsidaceae cyanobacterium CP_BM_RX_35]|nr:monooxygenase [Chroococcidiopsidaceae cyanobacterium CP_BM_RX_35]